LIFSPSESVNFFTFGIISVGFHEIDFFTIGIGEFFHIRNHLGGIPRDLFFHLRNHLGGISWDWFFHHRNRWIFHLRNHLGGISRDEIFHPSIISREFCLLIYYSSEPSSSLVQAFGVTSRLYLFFLASVLWGCAAPQALRSNEAHFGLLSSEAQLRILHFLVHVCTPWCGTLLATCLFPRTPSMWPRPPFALLSQSMEPKGSS
jgi:hypothetical protein